MLLERHAFQLEVSEVEDRTAQSRAATAPGRVTAPGGTPTNRQVFKAESTPRRVARLVTVYDKDSAGRALAHREGGPVAADRDVRRHPRYRSRPELRHRRTAEGQGRVCGQHDDVIAVPGRTPIERRIGVRGDDRVIQSTVPVAVFDPGACLVSRHAVDPQRPVEDVVDMDLGGCGHRPDTHQHGAHAKTRLDTTHRLPPLGEPRTRMLNTAKHPIRRGPTSRAPTAHLRLSLPGAFASSASSTLAASSRTPCTISRPTSSATGS